MSIADNLSAIKKELPSEVNLVAVSKFKSNEVIMEAYTSGHRCFGENRPQELALKMKELPMDINWHFIGHLQTNKIKLILDRVTIIESVDSIKLLNEIDNESKKIGKITDCLLEYHVSIEDSKQGLSAKEISDLVSSKEKYTNIRICGLMAMASFVEDESIISQEFSRVKILFDQLKTSYFADCEYFKIISMGMSSDYQIAIKEGSNNVRIGTKIFGERYSS